MQTHEPNSKPAVFNALLNLEQQMDPQNLGRPKSLSKFWVGPRGRCSWTLCYSAAHWDFTVARAVVQRIAYEIVRHYGQGIRRRTASKTIYAFNARPTTTPTTLYYLACAARTRLFDEMSRQDLEVIDKPQPIPA